MTEPSASSDALRVIIDNYRYSVGSYAQFLRVLHPVIEELPARDEEAIATRTREAMAHFRAKASREEVAELISVIGRMAPTKPAEGDAEASKGRSAPLPPADAEPADVSISMSPNVGHAVLSIFKSVRAHTSAAEHREILYRGVLTGLVGQFEVLIADLAHHYFRRAPGAISGDEKILSAKELLSFSSLDAAKDFIISDRVDDLLRGSADDWAKFFEKRMKLDLQSASPDWLRFVERIQRRHLIVHAGSRISRRYLDNVHSTLLTEYFDNPQVGQPVHLSAAYIERTLEDFENTGLVIGFAVWAKLHPDMSDAQSDTLTEVVYEAIREQRWGVVLHLAQWGSSHGGFDASTKLVCKLNCWLALKRLGRFGECEKEIRALDCSALSARFRLVRLALLSEHDEFFEELEDGGASDLDDRAWDEWPILDEVRSDPRFASARDRLAPRTQPALASRASTESPAQSQLTSQSIAAPAVPLNPNNP